MAVDVFHLSNFFDWIHIRRLVATVDGSYQKKLSRVQRISKGITDSDTGPRATDWATDGD